MLCTFTALPVGCSRATFYTVLPHLTPSWPSLAQHTTPSHPLSLAPSLDKKRRKARPRRRWHMSWSARTCNIEGGLMELILNFMGSSYWSHFKAVYIKVGNPELQTFELSSFSPLYNSSASGNQAIPIYSSSKSIFLKQLKSS